MQLHNLRFAFRSNGFDHGSAALIILEVIKFQCRLSGLFASPKAEQSQSPEELLGWLRAQVPFVEALVKSMPSDVDLQRTQEPRPEVADDGHSRSPSGQKNY